MSTDKTIEPANKPKDKWEKADIILKPASALLTAITIALVGFFANYFISKYQQRDARVKLFTELMSHREDSESALRKDMFNSIMNNILTTKDKSSVDEKILQLELLAYNFHESLNLMPLFEYLERINNQKNINNPVLRDSYKSRLFKMSDAIIQKQISALEAVYKHKDCVFTFVQRKVPVKKQNLIHPQNHADSMYFNMSKFSLNTIPLYACFDADTDYVIKDTLPGKDNRYKPFTQSVKIQVSGYDETNESATINLFVNTFIPAEKPDKQRDVHQATFVVNHFEFPMIDNTRLENDMRLAVVMKNFTVSKNPDDPLHSNLVRIEFSVVYFPSSLASLKEKSNLNDLLLKFEAEN